MINYIRIGLIISVLVVLYYITTTYYDMKVDLANEHSSVMQYKEALDYQDRQLILADEKVTKAIIDANKTNEVVRTKFKTLYVTTFQWEGDKNETDANNTIKFWRTIKY